MSIRILPTRYCAVTRSALQGSPKTFNLWLKGLDIQGALEAGFKVSIEISDDGDTYEYRSEKEKVKK